MHCKYLLTYFLTFFNIVFFFEKVLACLFAVALAGPNDPIPIVHQDTEVGFDGAYHSSFETGNGIVMQEQGVLKNAGQKDVEAEEVQGSYQYTGDDGQTYSVKYVANENGYHAEGAHLPVAPPVPEAIARSLQWNEQHPEPKV